MLTKIALAVFLTCSFSHNANAQKFLEKIGKAINSANKVLDEANSVLNGEATTTSAECTVTCKIPNLKIEFKGVETVEGQQVLSFVMRNTGSTAIDVDKFEDMKNFDDDGEEYSSRSMVGKSMTSLGNGSFTFEPGVPVKGKIILLECPQTVKKMSLMQIRTKIHDKSQGWLDTFIEFRNVPLQ